MPGRCVVGGSSALPDVQKGLILHSTPILDDECPETRKCRQKWVDFVKQKRAKWEPTQNSSICSRHFTQDYIHRFSFVDKVTNKPFMPRLTRDETGIIAVPSVHAEVVTKTPVVTERAKRCLERAVRMRESLPSVLNFLIYLYCERKASEIKNSYFILDAQKCEEEDAEYIFVYLEYKQRQSHTVH